jgi:hypothetical protein
MQKFALFDVEVTIHEVGNVPQLQGEFSAHYKFKGGRPKARDSLGRKFSALPGAMTRS